MSYRHHIFQLFLSESVTEDSFIEFELAIGVVQEGILARVERQDFLD
jgi:hypothetical protein